MEEHLQVIVTILMTVGSGIIGFVLKNIYEKIETTEKNFNRVINDKEKHFESISSRRQIEIDELYSQVREVQMENKEIVENYKARFEKLTEEINKVEKSTIKSIADLKQDVSESMHALQEMITSHYNTILTEVKAKSDTNMCVMHSDSLNHRMVELDKRLTVIESKQKATA